MNAKQKKSPELSLCMIVRNEEAYLEECLQSVAGVADEILIVDTGSTDGTIDIARKHGATVYEFPWQDDFSAARNHGLKQAIGRWILYLDADERLLPESVPELRRVMQLQGAVYVNVLIENSHRDGNKFHITRGHRLFRNVRGVHFSGRIHEQVSPFFASIDGEEIFSSIRIRHLGYAKPEAEMRAKEERNYRLLQQQIADEPQNPYWHFTLAQNLILKRRFQEALEELQITMNSGEIRADIRCSVYNNLADIHLRLGDLTLAREFAEKALVVNPEQTLAHLLLYKIYCAHGDRKQQIAHLKKVLYLQESDALSAAGITTDAGIETSVLCLNLGKLYLAEGECSAAREYFCAAARLGRRDKQVLTGLAECFLSAGDYDAARGVLSEVLQENPEDTRNLEKLALLCIKRGNLRAASEIYEMLVAAQPGNVMLKKRLAGLYHKLGEKEKSRQVLLAVHREQKIVE